MENTTVSFGATLSMLIEGKKYSAARDVLETMHAADIAMMFEECSLKVTLLLFRLLPKELAAETFVEMDEEKQKLLIQSFSDSELKDVIDELYMDDAVDLVGEMPANVVKRILRQADPEMRKMINEILKYPEDSAGSIMTTEYVSLRPDMTVEDAIKRIRRTGVDKVSKISASLDLKNSSDSSLSQSSMIQYASFNAISACSPTFILNTCLRMSSSTTEP